MEAVAASLRTKVLNAALGELLNQIIKAKDKAIQYEEVLQRMEDTITSIAPIVKEIEDLDRILDNSDEETKKLILHIKEGKDLVKESVEKVRWWNCCWTRPSYHDKLTQLDGTITRFVNVIMQVQQTRNEKKILARVMDVQDQLREIGRGSGVVFGGEIVGACAVPEAPRQVVGLDIHVKELKIRMFRSGTDLIVVTAPGGCGKTTLVQKFCHDEDIKGMFQGNIFFIAVSRSPNIKTIISRMFKHKSGRVPEFQNEDDAVNQLEELLRRIRSPKLLVLDDVWSGSETFLEKFWFRIPDYKIMVTSRFLFPRFGHPYRLTGLNHENSMTLFRDAACLADETTDIPDELIIETVEGCKGIPLALKVVGRSLCRQPPIIWQQRLTEWRKGVSILESDNDILNRLRTSLDFPESKAVLKDCFLDLGSFPEDQRIPATALVDMWIESYDLNEDGVSSIANIYELCNRNLATLIITREKVYEFENNYSQHFVMQHDLLRELAIVESSQEPVEYRRRLFISISKNNFPSWWKDHNGKHNCARLLAISTDEAFSSTWPNLQAPGVEIMVLSFWGKSYALPNVENMKKMKVLIITNYGSHPAQLRNFQEITSLPNLRRIRMDHLLIPRFFCPNIEFRNLQKLSFVMCKIDNAFENCDYLIPEALPNLADLSFDYCDDLLALPAGFCDLPRLQRLNILNCHNLSVLPGGIEKLTSLGRLTLSSCTGLSGLPSSIGKMRSLTFLDVSYCLRLEGFPREMGDLQSLRRLDMRKCLRVRELPRSVSKLKALKEVICDEDGANLWRNYQRDLPNLKIATPEEDINLLWLGVR